MKLPVLAGSRIAFVGVPENAEVLRPPAPVEPVRDVGAAARDALRFPLAGEPLEALVTRAGTATIVVEHPSLPLPSTEQDPRQEALAATADELERLGVAFERQTLLVAGGLERRARRHELERLVSPEFARRFRGRVVVHDVEDPGLRELPSTNGVPVRVNPVLLESDLVVTVTAAETVLHGGPACLVASAGADVLREARADSLLEPGTSRGWDAALLLERSLARHVPIVGVSVALDHPRLGGALRGFSDEEGVAGSALRSPLGRGFRMLPDPIRRSVLRSLPLELNASAVYAGPPSVAHAEALLRATESRATPLEGKLDALCIGVPFTTPHLPREPPNPVLAAYHALGLALRLWRDDFPIADGGTAILVHHFHGGFSHAQHPYRVFFRGVRDGAGAETVAAAEAAVRLDERGTRSYRQSRSCHPLLPFVDWEACAPARARLGAVLVAGCRDSSAARRLGFVPTHGVAAALEMAEGRAGRTPRIGFVPAPPYFPLQVRA